MYEAACENCGSPKDEATGAKLEINAAQTASYVISMTPPPPPPLENIPSLEDSDSGDLALAAVQVQVEKSKVIGAQIMVARPILVCVCLVCVYVYVCCLFGDQACE